MGGLEFQERNGFRDGEERVHRDGREDEREAWTGLERRLVVTISDQPFIFNSMSTKLSWSVYHFCSNIKQIKKTGKV